MWKQFATMIRQLSSPYGVDALAFDIHAFSTREMAAALRNIFPRILCEKAITDSNIFFIIIEEESVKKMSMERNFPDCLR